MIFCKYPSNYHEGYFFCFLKSYKIRTYWKTCIKRGVEDMVSVKVFDYEHEKDLEIEINQFLKNLDEDQLIDIKYHVATMYEDDEEDQIYCFSAMVIYRK
jgi:Sporulation protein Cse60